MGPLSSGVPDLGVVGSELAGDPLEAELCDGVLVPSTDSAEELPFLRSLFSTSPSGRFDVW